MADPNDSPAMPAGTSPLTWDWSSSLDEASGRAFDDFVAAAPYGHYSQTRLWARVTAASHPLLPRFFRAFVGGKLVGAAVVLRPGKAGLVAPLAWVERGPVCLDSSWMPAVLSTLGRACRARLCAYLHVMPYVDGEARLAAEADLVRGGFRCTQKPSGTHASTLRLSLDGPDEGLFAGSERETLRRKLRRAAKEGLVVRRGAGQDVRELQSLYDGMMSGQGRKTNPPAWFAAVAKALDEDPENCALFLTEGGGTTQNATFTVRCGRLATFVMGASSQGEAAYSKSVLGMEAAIRWAKAQGCLQFDLGGIPIESDTDPKRLAIARFKQDFARGRVELAQSHGRWVWG